MHVQIFLQALNTCVADVGAVQKRHEQQEGQHGQEKSINLPQHLALQVEVHREMDSAILEVLVGGPSQDF